MTRRPALLKTAGFALTILIAAGLGRHGQGDNTLAHAPAAQRTSVAGLTAGWDQASLSSFSGGSETLEELFR